MTEQEPAVIARVERRRRLLAIAGLWVIGVSLVSGLIASLTGAPVLSHQLFTIALVLLVAMPITGVVAVLAEEIARRDWLFAAAALGVLGLIAYRLIEALRQ